MSNPQCALILARISKAEWIITPAGARALDAGGVNSQVADLLGLAADLGWTVGASRTHHILENDVSAFRVAMCTMPDGRRERRPRRPEFWRALAMLASGQADGVLTVDLDRTARHPRDLESLIDAAELHHVPVVDLAGEIDLSTNEGRGRARNKVARANEASADTSRRIVRKLPGYAANGRHLGGPRRFGFRAEGPVKGRYLVLVPEEADIIKLMADQVLGGVSLRQVALDLRSRGLLTSKGNPWSAQTVRRLLLSPSIAGLQTYRKSHPAGVPQRTKDRLYSADQIIGAAPFPAIIERPEWEALCAKLLDPSRRTNPGAPPRHLLSLLAVCGRCGSSQITAGMVGKVESYRCGACSGSRALVPSAAADLYVAEVAISILASPRAADLLPSVSSELPKFYAERKRLREVLNALAVATVEGTIDDEQFRAGSAHARRLLEAVEGRIQASEPHSPLAGLAGNPEAARAWEALSLGSRRAVVRALATVTLYRGGASFDPACIVMTPRDAAVRD